MTFLASAPSLKMIRVGMERTWYCAAVTWFSSTLSLTMRRSSRSCAISSRTGATRRHGPHHGAQKSTSTGVSDSMTSAWKFASVTSVMMPAIRGLLVGFASESIARLSPLRDDLCAGEREEQSRRDPDLDRARDDEDRDGDGRGHEGGGQQLLPAAGAARDRPRRERQEQREQL